MKKFSIPIVVFLFLIAPSLWYVYYYYFPHIKEEAKTGITTISKSAGDCRIVNGRYALKHKLSLVGLRQYNAKGDIGHIAVFDTSTNMIKDISSSNQNSQKEWENIEEYKKRTNQYIYAYYLLPKGESEYIYNDFSINDYIIYWSMVLYYKVFKDAYMEKQKEIHDG